MAPTLYSLPLQPRCLNAETIGSVDDYRRFREQQQQSGPKVNPLSETTKQAFEYLIGRWKAFCEQLGHDAVGLVCQADFADFTTFFQSAEAPNTTYNAKGGY